MLLSWVTSAALACLISASNATSKQKICTEYTIPVHPTSINYIWAKDFQNNFDVVDFISNVGSRTAATDLHPYSGGAQSTGNYSISATFCSPKNATNANGIVLLLSHGLNFDRTYWDPSIQPEKYSFVDWAISLGYSVFFYDRLGVAKSTLVSGYVNQASIQVAILDELATAVKAGKYTGSTGTPKSLVLVGHSFGSALSAAVVTASPDLVQGLILTGFSYNGSNGAGFLESFAPRIASQEHSKWDKLDNGYLTAADIYSNVNVFFKAPDYDLEVVKYAHRNRQPFAINEAISGTLIDVDAKNFTGPAMIISGQFDLIFCTGQCDDVIEHPAEEIFSKAKAFKAVSYPGAGHGLFFAANVTGAFATITDFLAANGL